MEASGVAKPRERSRVCFIYEVLRELSLKTLNLFAHRKVFLLSPFIALIQSIHLHGDVVESFCDLSPERIQLGAQLFPQKQTQRVQFVFSHRHVRKLSHGQSIAEIKQPAKFMLGKRSTKHFEATADFISAVSFTGFEKCQNPER
jgi:hypothetical protein